MQIAYFFHTQPTKFGTTYSTYHVITWTIVHFDNEHLTSGTWFNIIGTMLRILANTTRCSSGWTLTWSTSRITCLIRMPFSLTMIAKVYITAGSFTLNSWTWCTSSGDYGIAIRSCNEKRTKLMLCINNIHFIWICVCVLAYTCNLVPGTILNLDQITEHVVP